MKKALICLLSMAFVVAMGGMVLAKVSGPCVNCHTMHNSQGGAEVNGDGPFGALVNNTCLGCHTTAGSDPLASGFPYVKSTSGAFTDQICLAGGFFPSGTDGTDNLGKAHSLGSTTAPPGYNLTWYQGASAPGLSCAGTRGCHGSQTVGDEMGAVKGGHHSPTVYRILWNYNNGGTPVGITGKGASDYEEALNLNTTAPAPGYTRTDATYAHNVYTAGATNDTISKLCANCHGEFHGAGTGSGSPWQRHPTDLALPTSWDAADDAISSNADCKYNPFGFVSGATDTTGAKYATCLSCHRAHGTASYDILRFAYNTGLGDPATGQSAGSGNMYGCLGCHSKQR